MADGAVAALADAVRGIACAAVESGRPAGVYYGTVTATEPLAVRIDQRLTLTAPFLVLSSLVSDFEVPVTVDHETADESHAHTVAGGVTGTQTHRHAVAGQKTVTLHLALLKGERVVLVRMQGGQKYLILDRVR